MSHINESCHISMSHVTYQWVMSHINESCHVSMSHVTYQWVMSHTNESCQYKRGGIWSWSEFMRTHECNTLHTHPATHCNTLQHTAVMSCTKDEGCYRARILWGLMPATHCNILQHTATYCNTLRHTATHCDTLQHTATHCNTLQYTVAKSREYAKRLSCV